MSLSSSHSLGKKAAAKKALAFVKDQMLIGLGTGSTASFFIEYLIEKCKQGLQIQAVATSKRSEEMALKGGIKVLDLNQVKKIDITFDGADEISPQKEMIKGGGGALLREKIIAYNSEELVILIDESKEVKALGKFPLPIEIISFGWTFTQKNIENLGIKTKLREKDHQVYLTDGGHFILDLFFDESIKNPQNLHKELSMIPGVVETGLFLDFNPKVVVGKEDGSTLVK